MSAPRYTVELSAEGMAVLRDALELYARIGMGQFADVAFRWGLMTRNWEARDAVHTLLRQAEDVAGTQSGIAEAPEAARMAWDVYKAVSGGTDYPVSGEKVTVGKVRP